MKQLKNRFNYDPTQPLPKQYQDSQVFNASYKCFDIQTNTHLLLSHFKTQNKNQINSLYKKFLSIKQKLAQGVNTKYIAKIHDVFLENKDKSLFLVLDYVEGESISQYIGKVYTLDWMAATRIICGLLSGLQELHKKDIVNCFINLENIQIDQNGDPKLSFKCMILKTIYLSPEFRKEQVKSKQSDFYSLGVCFYRLLYGVFPFKTQINEEIVDLVKSGPKLILERENDLLSTTYPAPIRQILKDLLNIQPQARTSALSKLQFHKKLLTPTSKLNPQIYNKLFKSKYINLCTTIDQSDQHQYTILNKKQNKLLRISIYTSSNQQIQKYIKNVVNKYAKINNQTFVKIYQYQIVQEENLVIVYSYCGEGNLLKYRKNLDSGEALTQQMIQKSMKQLKKAVAQLDDPHKYITNENLYLKSGILRLKYPDFPTAKFQKQIKKQASSQEAQFIAPQILNGKQSNKCDSWSLGVLQYWMIFNQMPKFDSKGTLVINKKQKLTKDKFLYFQNVLEKNPGPRLNIFDQNQVKSRLKYKKDDKQSPQKQANRQGSPNKRSKQQKQKQRQKQRQKQLQKQKEKQKEKQRQKQKQKQRQKQRQKQKQKQKQNQNSKIKKKPKNEEQGKSKKTNTIQQTETQKENQIYQKDKPSKEQKSKVKKSKRKQTVQLDDLQEQIQNNANILPNVIQLDRQKLNKTNNKQPLTPKNSKNSPNLRNQDLVSSINSHVPIVIQSSRNNQATKNPNNKFNLKTFDQISQMKSPKQAITKQKPRNKRKTSQQQQPSQPFINIQKIQLLLAQIGSKFGTLQRNYTKPVRVSIKCIIAILFYLFLFYFNFFKINGYLIGQRQSYQVKVIQIRAFPFDTMPNINYTLVTKTPIQTNRLFYNTTLTVLRDKYRCVLNDYSVGSNVVNIIKSSGFGTYQVIGFLIAVVNIIIVCLVIAKLDLCKVCCLTNWDEKKYTAFLNYGIIILALISLTSLHYLIYGGLYHLMLQPCLGKTLLPGVQYLFKNWTNGWVLRFIWIYIGIAIAYAVIIFFLIKPLKLLHKYVYIFLLILYFTGVGLRGLGRSYPAYQNIFGLCGELFVLIVGVCLLLVDILFACCTKSKTQANVQNNQNIDTGSIQDFNRTEEFLFGDSVQGQQDLDEK